MDLRTRKTKIWWTAQLIVLCLMLSAPFWLREDFDLFQPVLRSFSNSNSDVSTLSSSQVLVIDFEKLDLEPSMWVSSKQLRLNIPVHEEILPLKGGRRLPANFKRLHGKNSLTWSLEQIEKITLRAPAALAEESVKVHTLDENERVSEYFEIGVEPVDLILHFVSSAGEKVQKKISIKYRKTPR